MFRKNRRLASTEGETLSLRIVTNHSDFRFNYCGLVNGAEGISDIEGEAAMGSGERAGKRASFKFVSKIVGSLTPK